MQAELGTLIQAQIGPPYVLVSTRGRCVRFCSAHGDGERPLGERSARVCGAHYERERPPGRGGACDSPRTRRESQARRELPGAKRPRVTRNSAISKQVAAAVELADRGGRERVALVRDHYGPGRVDPDGEGLGVAGSGLILHLDREGEQPLCGGSAGDAAGANTLGEQLEARWYLPGDDAELDRLLGRATTCRREEPRVQRPDVAVREGLGDDGAGARWRVARASVE